MSEDRDLNAGLMGPMIISRRGATKPDGTPKDVDRELVVAFYEIDENMSWHFDHNLNTYTTAKPKVTPDMLVFFHPFGLSNFKESLNGFLFGHLAGLTMRVGERVRWYLMASTNFEVHAAHWHGNTVVIHHMRTDVAPLVTMGMVVADMVPDNPGTWLFHCHVREHLNAGMQSLYTCCRRRRHCASGDGRAGARRRAAVRCNASTARLTFLAREATGRACVIVLGGVSPEFRTWWLDTPVRACPPEGRRGAPRAPTLLCSVPAFQDHI